MCLSSSASNGEQEKAPIAAGGSRKGTETAGLEGGKVHGDGERKRESKKESLWVTVIWELWRFTIFLLFGKTHRLLVRERGSGTKSKMSYHHRRCVCVWKWEGEGEKVRESVCTNKTRENCSLILFHYALKGNLIISLFTVRELQASVWASLMTT